MVKGNVMNENQKIAVIIAAAGMGTRMGSTIPKQFMSLGGISILVRTVRAFETNTNIDTICIVTNEESVGYCQELLIDQNQFQKVKQIIAGGLQRQDSVYKGLGALDPDVDYVLVHDGARPFVTEAMINRLVSETIKYGAAVMAVPVKDTIKTADCGVFVDTPDRSKLYAVQTPQGFEKGLLRRAYEHAFHNNFYGTDDAVLVEKLNQKVYLVNGDYSNIKITTKEDLAMGEAILSFQGKNPRVGTGFDVHQLVEHRELVLGGVRIPFEKGLLGHSDADVLLHAIMDGLLGAAALGDIGRHFPDSDPSFCGISSILLLEKVGELIREEGYKISNIDAIVIAERPKIAAFIDEMRENIAKALLIEINQINIKGTTTEKLGFCGRQEGIAAEASVLII